jgi:hypothetical protein
MDDRAEISLRYARFADTEARGHSPLYEAIARGVAADEEIIGLLLTLPTHKRQPNLLLAAVRLLFGTPTGWTAFRETLLAHRDTVRAVMQSRATQTNEPARCATLLPVLAQLPQPLALIEVGASAGLCLLLDCYGYDYGQRVITPGTAAFPLLGCAVNDATPIPAAVPQIAWRAGLDLNPVDAADPGQTAWLETLVWPEQTGRLANLRAAIRIAATVRPRIVSGDLLSDALERLCDEAPKHATLVIFHTAVLAYVPDPADRQAFADRAIRLGTWVSNETPGVFPAIAQRTERGAPGRFLLSLDGAPIAWTDPHGACLDWIAA